MELLQQVELPPSLGPHEPRRDLQLEVKVSPVFRWKLGTGTKEEQKMHEDSTFVLCCVSQLRLLASDTADWVASITGVYFLAALDTRGTRSKCRQTWFFWSPSPVSILLWL